MPTSARASLGFFGRFADAGIRAPEQNGLLQQALTRKCASGSGPSRFSKRSPFSLFAPVESLCMLSQVCSRKDQPAEAIAHFHLVEIDE